MAERRKRLIEVAFPLAEVSERSRREKNVRQVAECLPAGDEDRRLLNGLLGSSARGAVAPKTEAARPVAVPLPI